MYPMQSGASPNLAVGFVSFYFGITLTILPKLLLQGVTLRIRAEHSITPETPQDIEKTTS